MSVKFGIIPLAINRASFGSRVNGLNYRNRTAAVRLLHGRAHCSLPDASLKGKIRHLSRKLVIYE
ncbi:MAG TPA: hypothetical protein DD670_17505 [Planctomycetaceae bacterium]|nr:hypothetical protein [Planctomycetaceae bacterium]